MLVVQRVGTVGEQATGLTAQAPCAATGTRLLQQMTALFWLVAFPSLGHLQMPCVLFWRLQWMCPCMAPGKQTPLEASPLWTPRSQSLVLGGTSAKSSCRKL